MSGNSALLATIQTPAASLGYMFAFIIPNFILFHFSGKLAIIVKAELEEMGIHFCRIRFVFYQYLDPNTASASAFTLHNQLSSQNFGLGKQKPDLIIVRARRKIRSFTKQYKAC